MRQFEFENADHFFVSGLALSPHRFAVTHQHGLYEVDDHGHVLAEEHGHPRRILEVSGARVVARPWSEDDYDGESWQTAVDWNGHGLLTKVNGDSFTDSYCVSMFARDLSWKAMAYFNGESVLAVKVAKRGWRLTLCEDKDMDNRRDVWIDQDGQVSFHKPQTR